MTKVIIASENPLKIGAVKESFRRTFPNKEHEFSGVSVSSEVSDQPSSEDETFRGAKKRADNASEEYDADFHVGIEGGIEHTGRETKAFAWVVIKSGEIYGKSRTGTFFLPAKIVELLNKGKELGVANDIVFGRDNSKHENGAVGILTGDIIDRKKFYTEALVLALIPFINKELY